MAAAEDVDEEVEGTDGEEQAAQPASSSKATDFMGKREISTGHRTQTAQ
ncbi:hypothetical protein [Hymenobacter canadensis]|uniref:Uncharacterized protein n=1 Tax=Hymenobacter canadensis TaxID=2999067 RepID=A0ABY7LXQ9_9BACT|nr:hypothetical protein [Hymenobacter canadensis]WBA43733.1 hypothetical protein O3303_09215 [Hymenobacter canadensis]